MELALWLSAAASIVAIRGEMVRTSMPLPDEVQSTRAESRLYPLSDRSVISDSVSKAAQFILEHDPFRVSHEPPSRPFGTALAASAPAALPAAPSLRGIVGAMGRLSVILAGVPGKDGDVVLQAGDSVAGYHLRRVTLSSAVIAGHDTTWTLQLGTP